MNDADFTRLSSDGWQGIGDHELELTEDETNHLLRVTEHRLWWAINAPREAM